MKLFECKKAIIFTALYTSACVLVACSPHKNPLQKLSDQKAVDVLLTAAIKSEKKLKLTPDIPTGGLYPECMKHKQPQAKCDILYKAMLSSIKKQASFKQMTLQDITDEQFYQRISEEYDQQYFVSGGM
ncbi:MAG: hypothetical protein P1U63_07960 [Coxiellaceae bacterium]|nr:hypothetical protein [Coxiellaceae bacterium]